MQIKLAIHRRIGSFSDRWFVRCEGLGIVHKGINCYASDIVKELSGVDGLMWHWVHYDPRDVLIARNLILAAERMGLKVFPNTPTCWHFDDKVAQKYLLESVSAPLASSYVFFDREEALQWIDKASFPKIFKLRRGAGSRNVQIVLNSSQARRLVVKAFGRGFTPIAGILSDLQVKASAATRRGDIFGKLRRLPQSILNILRINRLMGRERGYVYFQDFLPDNFFDTRVTVVGDRAFAFTRDVRPGDFRASGSGRINYDMSRIDIRCVSTAMEVTKKIRSQSAAFDFALDASGNPRILEISYCYDAAAVHDCPGYWDSNLNWFPGNMWPQDAILDDLLKEFADNGGFRTNSLISKA